MTNGKKMSDCVYVTMDLETGGVTTNCSLLTAYFGFLDENLNLLDHLDLKVKPNNGEPYVVQAGGLAVNGINLIEHDKVALTESQCGELLMKKLKQHSKNGKIKLIPIGHNVQFDILFIYEHLLSKKNFDMYVSYRKLDTGTIAQFFKLCGFIPNDKSGSLEYLAELFGVKFKDRAHTAESDAMMCVQILQKMREACLKGLSR